MRWRRSSGGPATKRGLDGPLPRLIWANGAPALALAIVDGWPDDVIYSLTLDNADRIDRIYVMRNPDKMPGSQ